MDKLKKKRAPVRSAFTKTANYVQHLINEDNIEKEDVQVAMDMLEKKAEELVVLNQKIMDAMIEENATEEEIEGEYETVNDYEAKLFLCRRKAERVLKLVEPSVQRGSEDDQYGTVVSRLVERREKKYKLPKIEFAKFNGDIKEWLAFWAQFKKIHEDEEMPDEDKFHYLCQSTVEKSKAREVVDSFPMTKENYSKVVQHMQDRFGNKVRLVEVYVRELLRLVLTNALNPSKKIILSSLYDKLETQLRALESLQVTRNEFAAILYPLVESCLPEDVLRAWERHRYLPLATDTQEIDRLTLLMLFLKSEVESEERISLARTGFGEEIKKTQKKEVEKNEIPSAAGLLVSESSKKTSFKCVFCNDEHYNNQCEKARRMSVSERQKICDQNKICYACIRKGHISFGCPYKSRLRCKNCDGRHHDLMCRNESSKEKGKTNTTLSKVIEPFTAASNMSVSESGGQTILSTLLVRIRNGNTSKVVRAAIDSGSHKTYLLKKIVKELGFKRIGHENLLHELFGGHQLEETEHGRYRIQAESLDGKYVCRFDVLEQERICFDVKRILSGKWLDELHRVKIDITDVGVGSTEIELLIGGNIAGRLLNQIHRLKNYENFVAMDYGLGWTIMGTVPCNDQRERTDTAMLVHTLFVREANISDLWRLDLIGIEEAAETKKKEVNLEEVVSRFRANMSINSEGRYEIPLPFIVGSPPLNSNRRMAEQRLISMSKKLSPQLKITYQNVFEEWETIGIIEEVPMDELENVCYYMPHKPVLNPNSKTTPVRPVFDASAKEKNWLSLNDCLEKGPNLLEVTTSIINKFRLWEFGVLSDIKKAFLQISIAPSNRDYLRFLWWENDTNSIKVYRHRRLVFGLTCSSFILAAIINEILDKSPPKYRETAMKLKNANYVDNCITSMASMEAVMAFKDEATYLLSTGQFELRGWEWNAPDISKEIQVLGLTWNLARDTLTCKIDKGNDLGNQSITKQIILSTAHKIFDPIGFTVPLIIYPKILLQQCCESKVGWKEPVPEAMAKKFNSWCNELAKVKEITIPRWVGLHPKNQHTVSLHVFADASKLAYNASVFLRVDEGTDVKVQLIQAKTRIAPIKKLSINRLELLGCVISTRLANSVKKDIGIDSIECVYWTDSANALHWITHDDQWGVYVWNRVTEIRSSSPIDAWRHIPGELNPADLPSRGCKASQLLESRWWEGPNWLKLPKENWPKSTAEPNQDVYDERKNVVIANWECSKEKADTTWLSNLNLDYGEMIRFVALMKRLVKNRYRSRVTGEFSVEELDIAENHILRSVQNETFMINDPLLNRMVLTQDHHGVLRIKTKLLLRDDLSTFKTPALLPNKHPIVKAIIKFYHMDNQHAQTQTLMAILREKFWIIRARETVSRVVKKCFVCNWYAAKPFETPPAQLPLERVKDASTFEVTGVDLTGHIYLGDGTKAWIVLYTCAVYRAISLDVVTSLTTDAYMQSMRRFIADKGRPKIMYSDHGTNLTGMENLLKEIDWEEIRKRATAKRIDWRFIPSKAPWWGGFWERLIGIVKNLLKRVLGKAKLDYDEIRTLVCEAAAIVNARPMTYLASDPSELEALSPSMFLKDIKEEGTPDLDSVNAKKFNERLQYRVRLKEELRKRFRSEYMSQLVHRKGANPKRSIELEELVLISNENQKRTLWPLAKVIELIPSKDGIIRVVKVKTSKGILERPVKLLIPLEIRQNEDVSTLGIPAEYRKEIESVTNDRTKKNPKPKMKPQEVQTKSDSNAIEGVAKVTRRGRVVKEVQRLGV